jgi:hypothetical protein
MKRALAVLFPVVLIGVLGAVPTSAFDIQSRTEQICECLCTRSICEYGADLIPISTTCPTGTVVAGGVTDGKRAQVCKEFRTASPTRAAAHGLQLSSPLMKVRAVRRSRQPTALGATRSKKSSSELISGL